MHKQHVEELGDYKARILQLENQVASLRVKKDGSSTSASIATRDIYLQSLQAEKDTAIEEANIAKSQALEVSTANQEMQGKIEALQK